MQHEPMKPIYDALTSLGVEIVADFANGQGGKDVFHVSMRIEPGEVRRSQGREH